ncbi:PLP-dependent aspartate aminotransferase family protein [bacterium]|nr:PLP-dependent aspartate aminotransferase family protein [bacterium]
MNHGVAALVSYAERVPEEPGETRPLKFQTRAIHVGNEKDPQTGAVVPPIHLATTFVQSVPGVWEEFDYSRSGNPTRANFEKTIGDLEGGVTGLAFASGMAAITNVMMSLRPGDQVLAGRDLYGGTYRLLHHVTKKFGITVQLVDTRELSQIEQAIEPATKLLWLETPGNPLLSITDLAGAIAIAHERGVMVGVDNTFATPVLTRPLELGADVVVHSATKFIGGHSDVLGGAVVAREKSLRDRLYFLQNATGSVLGPFESYLASRGLKTMTLRVREQCRSTQVLAEFLARHPRVTKVLYPGLASHPGHSIASRQMAGGFGAVLSFEVAGDIDVAKKVCTKTHLFQLAVSLGAVESLIEHPASMTHATYSPADRRASGIEDSLIRISVGLEDVDDLKEDLDQALSTAS